MKTEIKKGNPLALLPLGVFLVLFLGSGVITGDFYKNASISSVFNSGSSSIVI